MKKIKLVDIKLYLYFFILFSVNSFRFNKKLFSEIKKIKDTRGTIKILILGHVLMFFIKSIFSHKKVNKYEFPDEAKELINKNDRNENMTI